MGHIEDVIPGEPSCETRDPVTFLGPGSPLRFAHDDKVGTYRSRLSTLTSWPAPHAQHALCITAAIHADPNSFDRAE